MIEHAEQGIRRRRANSGETARQARIDRGLPLASGLRLSVRGFMALGSSFCSDKFHAGRELNANRQQVTAWS